MPRIQRIQRVSPGTVRAVEADVSGPVTRLGQSLNVLGQQMEQARQSRETNEAVTEATRRVLAHEDDLKTRPDEFASWTDQHGEFLKETRDELSTTIEDSTVREAVNERLNTLQVHSEVRVRQGARGREINEGRSAIVAMEDVLSDNYSKMRTDGDRNLILDGIEDALEDAVDNGIISPEESEQRKQGFLNRAEKLRALVDIDENPEVALTQLNAGAYDLEPEDVRIVKDDANRAIARNLEAKKSAAAAKQQETWTTIYDGIDQDKMGRAEIDKAHNTTDPVTGMRGLSEQGTRALLGHLKRHDKDKAKASTRRGIYQTAVINGEPLDHKTKEDREAAEQAFLDIAPELPSLEPREVNSLLINDILRPTKIWPKSLQRQMRIAAKSANPEMIENFANLYDRVSTDPSVSAVNVSMVNEDQAFWESIASFRRAGMFTPDSIALARHNAYELTDDDRAALKQVYKDKKYIKGNKITFGELVDQFDPTMDELRKFPNMNWSALFEGAPDAPPGMVADYQNMVKQFYFLTSDIETARKLAGEAVEHAWTVEEFDEGAE